MESPDELWREFDKLQWWMGYCLRWHQSKPREECRCWRPQKHFHQPIHQFDFRPRDGTSIICFDFDYRNLKGVFLAAFIRESNNFPLLIFLDAERSRRGRNGSYIIVFIRQYLLGLIPFCSFIPHAELSTKASRRLLIAVPLRTPHTSFSIEARGGPKTIILVMWLVQFRIHYYGEEGRWIWNYNNVMRRDLTWLREAKVFEEERDDSFVQTLQIGNEINNWMQCSYPFKLPLFKGREGERYRKTNPDVLEEEIVIIDCR